MKNRDFIKFRRVMMKKYVESIHNLIIEKPLPLPYLTFTFFEV
jgi:hypothetical protein